MKFFIDETSRRLSFVILIATLFLFADQFSANACPLISGLPSLASPRRFVQGMDLTVGCLKRQGDRYHTVKKPSADKHDGEVDDLVLLATDLCAMGHTTKEPAHFASFLLDRYCPDSGKHINRNQTVSLTVLYGNKCMTRQRNKGGNKRSGVFWGVLRGWFRAMFHQESSLVATLQGCGVHFKSTTSVESDHESGKMVSLVAEERYFDELGDSLVCSFQRENQSEHLQLVKREERWRWFRTPHHAAIFRESLLQFYGVPLSNRAETLRRSIVILRRDEDRHFDELAVAKRIGLFVRKLNFDVHLRTFDNIRGAKGQKPPSHQQQLAIIHNANILIAAHGAGLALIAAMRPGGVVIELFPHNFRYHMYQELAQAMDVKYIPFESPVVSPTGCCNAAETIDADIPSKLNGIRARACKKCDILVSASEWSSMIRTAVSHVLLSE